MTQDQKWEDGQEVNSAWFKFEEVGDTIMGTLLSKRDQEGQGNFPDQKVYEVRTKDDGVVNVGISVNKTGTIQRLNNCKVGEIIGIKYDKEGEAKPGMHPAKYLVVKSFGMDPDFNEFEDTGEDVDSGATPPMPEM